MFGQYSSLKTCDELEVQRLLWGGNPASSSAAANNNITSSGRNNIIVDARSNPRSSSNSHSSSMHHNHSSSSHSSSHGHGGNGVQVERRLSVNSHRTDKKDRSHGHHHSSSGTHHQSQFQPTFNNPQYSNNVGRSPAPAHTQSNQSSSSLSGFTPAQCLSFIPQTVLPYQLHLAAAGNKFQMQQVGQQHQTQQLFTSVSARDQMPSMPNLFSNSGNYTNLDNFVQYNANSGGTSSSAFFQPQTARMEASPSPNSLHVEREASEDEQEVVEEMGEDDSRDQDYEAEEEDEDEDEFEAAAADPESLQRGPFNCGFCGKVYHRKNAYLDHLKSKHNRAGNANPPPAARPPPMTPAPPTAPTPPRPIRAGDLYHCPICPKKKFKTERNYEKHARDMHGQNPPANNPPHDARSELERAISGITELTATYGSGGRNAFAVPTYVTQPPQAPPPVYQLFKCPHCPSMLEDNEKLRGHQVREHNAKICSDCAALVPFEDFVKHKKTHLIEPCRWTCKKCPTLSFDVYKDFKAHFQSHVGEVYKEPSVEFLTRKVPAYVEPPPEPPAPTPTSSGEPAPSTPGTSTSGSRNSTTLPAAAADHKPGPRSRTLPRRAAAAKGGDDSDDEIKKPVYVPPKSPAGLHYDDDDDFEILYEHTTVRKPVARQPAKRPPLPAAAKRPPPKPKAPKKAKTPPAPKKPKSPRPSTSRSKSRSKGKKGSFLEEEDDDPPFTPRAATASAIWATTSRVRRANLRKSILDTEDLEDDDEGRNDKEEDEDWKPPTPQGNQPVCFVDYEIEVLDLEPDLPPEDPLENRMKSPVPARSPKGDGIIVEEVILDNDDEDDDFAGESECLMDDAYDDDANSPLATSPPPPMSPADGAVESPFSYSPKSPVPSTSTATMDMTTLPRTFVQPKLASADKKIKKKKKKTKPPKSAGKRKSAGKVPILRIKLSQPPCLICGDMYPSNAEMQRHILEEHCSGRELKVELLGLEKDLELLGADVEILEVEEDDGLGG